MTAQGGPLLCQGWLPTAEARMACCEDEALCPMHAKQSNGSGTARAVTQEEADDCCAWSEQQQPSGTHETVAVPVSSAVLGSGVAVPAAVPRLMLTDDWRTASPDPSPPLDRSVLHSTFLI